jgi:hypothetical protein
MTFSPSDGAWLKPVPSHPLHELVTGRVANVLVVFPHLPIAPIQAGYKWKMASNTTVGTSSTLIAVENTYEYTEDSDCPSGGGSCVVLRLTAASDRVPVDSANLSGFVAYGFAGRIYFDTENGRVDEARVEMAADIEAKGSALHMNGAFSVRHEK